MIHMKCEVLFSMKNIKQKQYNKKKTKKRLNGIMD